MLQAPLPYLYRCTQQVGRLQQPPDTGCGGCGRHCLQAIVPLKEQPTMEYTSHGKPLEVYCNTCDKLFCQICTTARAHRNHEYEPISDAFPRHQQQIMDSLQQIKEKLATITAAVQALEDRKSGFLEQVQAVRREIEATVQQLIQLLQESERQLRKELDQVIDAHVEKISAREKEADITIAQLKSCEEFTEEELRIGSQQEILVMKGQMVEHMGAVCSQLKEDNLQPLEETRLRFVKSTSVVEACRSLGSVVDFGKVKVKAGGNKACFSVYSAVPLSSELISCQVSSVADPTIVLMCVVQQVAPGSFEVHYRPPTGGLHQVRMQVEGADILDTPLTVEFEPRTIRQGYTKLSRPFGLAVIQEGHLIVTEWGKHCITIINTTEWNKIRSFGRYGSQRKELCRPAGVALTQDGHIVVADCYNHRLQILTVEGTLVSSVCSYGSQPLQFRHPRGVAVHHNGNLFVTDSDNHRVQVLNSDLTYSHSFSSKGSSLGELNEPRGVTIDSDGMVYVADRYNNRVQKFTPEGEVLAVIDRKGEGGSQLNKPYGVYVDSNNILYVTEYGSNTVCMFSTSGRFLGYVGSTDGSSFEHPYFITSDQYGKLYSSDYNGVSTY